MGCGRPLPPSCHMTLVFGPVTRNHLFGVYPRRRGASEVCVRLLVEILRYNCTDYL